MARGAWVCAANGTLSNDVPMYREYPLPKIVTASDVNAPTTAGITITPLTRTTIGGVETFMPTEP